MGKEIFQKLYYFIKIKIKMKLNVYKRRTKTAEKKI